MKKFILLACFLGVIPLVKGTFRGPIQPEYASYEDATIQDMVNLSSGDFTYSIPMLTVPAPGGGGYSMSLSYHAGIELNEEASWVGLGWSANVGAINRVVNQIPDDASGSSIIHSSAGGGGNGYSVNWGVFSKSYDSNEGKGGRIGLGDILRVGYGNQKGLTVISINADFKTGRVTADPAAVANSLITVASYASNPMAIVADVKSEVVGAALANNTVGMNWDGVMTNQNMVMRKWTSGIFNQRKNYSYYYKSSRTDNAYGSLNFSSLNGFTPPTSNEPYTPSYTHTGKASPDYLKELSNKVSDVSYNTNASYPTSIEPVHIAYDNYAVLGPSVSGRISPYRLDMGSVVMHNNGRDWDETTGTYKTAANPWEENMTYSLKPWASAKPHFRYISALSNQYSYHKGTAHAGYTSNSSDITNSNYAHLPEYNFGSNDYMYDATKFIESRVDNTLHNNQLANGKHIEYFNYAELQPGSTVRGLLKPLYRVKNGSVDYVRSANGNKIEAIVITNTNGYRYHFALPVKQLSRKFYSGTAASSYYQNEQNDDIAVTWLLTSITGPDFIDRIPVGVADKNDWGYWVSFNYGKFSNDYRNRSPYREDLKNRTIKSNDQTDYFEVSSETFYLNEIETASHFALFVKSEKEDGRSHFDTYRPGGSRKPSTSLKLDEIVVLERSKVEALKSDIGGGHDLDFDDGNNIGLANGDSYAKILDSRDITTSQWAFIRANQQMAVKFTYDYSLCQNTPNSFSSASSSPTNTSYTRNGKLTLTDLAIHGKDDIKQAPDYEFGYANNPNYGENMNDGWGMYSSLATDHKDKHMVTDAGDEWSLTNITTPVGSEIIVDYERDSYSSLCGLDLIQSFNFDRTASFVTGNILRLIINTNLDVRDFYSIGDNVTFNRLRVEKNMPGNTGFILLHDQSRILTNVGSNFIEIDLGSPSPHNNWSTINEADYISKYVSQKDGDGVRVKSISIVDQNSDTMRTKYFYSEDGTENGLSSGVASIEPDYIHLNRRLELYPQYTFYDCPGPMIVYGNVTVLTNIKQSGIYHSKEVYEFEPPSVDAIQRGNPVVSDYNFTNNGVASRSIKTGSNLIISTSKIGRLNSFKSFVKGHLYKEIDYGYEDFNQSALNHAKIGYFTQGAILTERLFDNTTAIYKNQRTIKLYTPNTMQAVTVKQNGVTKTVINSNWDMITGAVTETEYESTQKGYFRTEMVPAYHKYSDMGHRLLDPNNAHLLSLPAANYLYSLANYGQSNEIERTLSAEASTYSNQWDYRMHDGSNWVWDNFDSELNHPDEWRHQADYVWKGDVNYDGTFKTSSAGVSYPLVTYVAFDWSNPTANPNWVKHGSIERYDYNALAPVETQSPLGIYSSARYDNSKMYQVMVASNAKYSEILFSGAEDDIQQHGADWYFNEEVLKGAGSDFETAVQNIHTGRRSLKVDHNDFGFIYKISDLAANYDINSAYQVGVWVKNANIASNLPTSAKFHIEYQSSGSVIYTIDQNLNTSNALKAGEWYLFTIDLPINNGGSINLTGADYIEIQTKCVGVAGDKVYLDDFRFYPTDSKVTSYVYDFDYGWKTAELDNNHLATKITYDDRGKAIKIEKEIFDLYAPENNGGFKIVSEHKYNFGRGL